MSKNEPKFTLTCGKYKKSARGKECSPFTVKDPQVTVKVSSNCHTGQKIRERKIKVLSL